MIGKLKISKTKIISSLFIVLMASNLFGKDKEKDTVLTLHGAIMDSQCGYNVHSAGHSHDWMIKRGIQGAHDEASCTQSCVKNMGGTFVLLVKDDVYKLEDQVQPEPFAGKKVKVSAILDAKTHTLHVINMVEDK